MKVLVIRFSSIGDIVLTFPIMRCLKEQIPNCELHLATKRAFSELVGASGSVDQCHLLGDSIAELTKQLSKEKFDVVIDLHNNLRSRLLCMRLGVKKTFRFRKLNFLKWILVQFKINRLPDMHVVHRYFEAVKKIGVTNDGKNNRFLLDNEFEIEQELNLQAGSYIAVAIGAQYETKQIPLSKLKEIISKIDGPVVLLGGKMDMQKADELIKLIPDKKVENACGKYSLVNSASIIKNSKSLLTGDTGLMHIASCFNIPIYVIWGNTTPSFGMSAYKPEGNKTIINFEVQNLTCRPCSKIGFRQCPKGHFDCMLMQNSEVISAEINKN